MIPSRYNTSDAVPGPVDVVYTVLEVTIAVPTIVGNTLVLIVFFKYRKLRTVTNYYVMSLAVADLLVGLVGIPSAILVSVGLPRDFHLCLVMSSLLMCLCTGSIFSLVAVSVDRYWAILHPLAYRNKLTRANAVVNIVVCWFLATVIGILPLAGWNAGKPREARCYFLEVIDTRYLVFIYFVTIIGPSLVISAVYTRIYMVVRSQVSGAGC